MPSRAHANRREAMAIATLKTATSTAAIIETAPATKRRRESEGSMEVFRLQPHGSIVAFEE